MMLNAIKVVTKKDLSMILSDEVDSDESQNRIIRLFQRDRVDLNSV